MLQFTETGRNLDALRATRWSTDAPEPGFRRGDDFIRFRARSITTVQNSMTLSASVGCLGESASVDTYADAATASLVESGIVDRGSRDTDKPLRAVLHWRSFLTPLKRFAIGDTKTHFLTQVSRRRAGRWLRPPFVTKVDAHRRNTNWTVTVLAIMAGGLMTPVTEVLPGALDSWRIITHLGSASLLLPTLAITAIGLGVSGQARAVRVWLSTLAPAVLLTLLTKIVFFGWGVGSANLDFTGISGHTLLATAVLPILFGWLLSSEKWALGRIAPMAGFVLGLLLSVAVGISRIVLGAHSMSEVAVAWGLGLAVCVLTFKAMARHEQRPWFALLAPAILLLASGTTASNFIPTHNWEVRLALMISGRDSAFTRQQMHSLARRTERPHDIGS